MMLTNLKAFFDGARRTMGGLNQAQVDGLNVILAEWDRRKLTEVSWLAYMLATAFHETWWMQPVIETRRRNESVNPSVNTAIARLDHAFVTGVLKWVKTPYWRKDANGVSWLGRGFVQLTHKSGYEIAAAKTGIDCVNHPELMLEAGPACTVMFGGMIGGWFTGKKLADYLGNGKLDYINARRIINGLDKAVDIAEYARGFERAIIAGNAP